MNVLVVEDNALQAKVEQTFMRQVLPGSNVDLAFSCQLAREKLQETSYDIILMDFGLPDGNGLDLTRELRNKGVKALIVAVSGNVDMVPIEKREAAGLDGGYPKPFTLKDAREVVSLYHAHQDAV